MLKLNHGFLQRVFVDNDYLFTSDEHSILVLQWKIYKYDSMTFYTRGTIRDLLFFVTQ